MRLTKHLYQVCGRNYGSHQNVYVIDVGTFLIMVDTGLNERDRAIIFDNLKYWKLDEKPIRAVLLTHEHYEHVGNASYFQERGALIYAHEAARANILKGGDSIMEYAYPELGPCASFKVDHVFTDGSSLSLGDVTIKVLEAPGHSKGSVLLEATIDGQIVVFSGDTILVTETCHKAAFGCTAGIDYDEKEYLGTLKRYSSHEADFLLPGHGEICMRGATKMFVGAYLRSRLDFARDHHRDYLDLKGDSHAD